MSINLPQAEWWRGGIVLARISILAGTAKQMKYVY